MARKVNQKWKAYERQEAANKILDSEMSDAEKYLAFRELDNVRTK